MKVFVESEVFKKYPNVKEFVIIAKGLNNNTANSRKIVEMLDNAVSSTVLGPEWHKGLPFAKWEEMLRIKNDFKDLEEDLQSAHVSLFSKIAEGKRIPNINPVVNFYNYLSVKYRVPIGGEDLATYYGNLRLVLAKGGELFVRIGGNRLEKVHKGEPVWRDDLSVTVRMWNSKQSERTKITNKSKDVIFVADIIIDDEGVPVIDLKEFQHEFVEGLQELLEAKTVQSYILDAGHASVEVGYDSQELPQGIDVQKFLKAYVIESEKVRGSKGIRPRKPQSLNLKDPSSISARLENMLVVAVQDFDWVKSGDIQLFENRSPQEGDFSTAVALKLAGSLKKTPAEIAQELVQSWMENREVSSVIERFVITEKGFINLVLKDSFLLSELQDRIADIDNLGKLQVGGGKRILIESPGWNPNKPPHVGHLLNAFLGKALIRLFEAVGFEVFNDDIDNDKGLPVMQTIWAYQHFGNGSTPDAVGEHPDVFVGRFYVMGAKAYKSDKRVQAEIREILRKWESGDAEIRRIWEKIVTWARDGQASVYELFGEKKDAYQWHESDVYQGGKDIVLKFLGKGIVEKLSDGAVIARIEQEYGLPDTILLKSDGTGLYHTQDINLTIQKKKKFKPWKIIWIVAEEQIVHFQRLFAILDALDIMPIDDLYHYAYSWVVDKHGYKLSSRSGEQMTAYELYDALFDAAKQVLEKRGGGKLDRRKIDKIARAVAIGSVKFAYLSTDPFKKIKFDIERAVSFTGKSGPYVMYAYTRAANILKKAGKISVTDIAVNAKINRADRKLLLLLLQYPVVLINAANVYAPSILAEYLYSVAKAFNNFYEKNDVLKLDDEQLKIVRMGIVLLTSTVLKHGLGILGISVLDEM